MLTASKPLAAWLSRHHPGPEHRRNLQAYQIVVLPDRWTSAQQAWGKTLTACGEQPALVIAIMPEEMLMEFVDLAAPTPVIRPKQAYGDQNHWTGKWERIGAVVKPTYIVWTPDEVQR